LYIKYFYLFISRANYNIAAAYEACQNRNPEPSMKYEKYRKKIYHSINSIFDNLKYNLENFEKKFPKNTHIPSIISFIYDGKM
jgi:hypothetical protein